MAIKTFEKFRSESGLTHSRPVTVNQIVQFLACYHDKGYVPSTLASYCSGLSFMHKINGFPDPTEDFVIGKMLEGCRRLDKRIDSRFPIRKHILQQLCLVLPKICFNNYEVKLFTAAYTLAYYGMLRASECVYTSASLADRPLQFSDIQIEGKQLWIKIRKSKTNQLGKPICLHIPPSKPASMSCFHALQQFISVHPSTPKESQFLCHNNKSPLTRYQFAAVLSKGIKHLGLPTANYKTHSFRIGRATDLSLAGVSSEQIKTAGRWVSNTYNKYVCPKIKKHVKPISIF